MAIVGEGRSGIGSASADYFSRIRDANSSLINHYRNILQLMDAMSQEGDFEQKEVTKRTWYYFGREDESKKLFQSLTIYAQRVRSVLNELIKVLEEENKSLTEYLSRLRPDTIDIGNQMGKLMISNSSKVSDLTSKLSDLIPGVAKVTDSIIGIVDEAAEEASKRYITFYNELSELVKAEKSLGDIFVPLKTVLLYLERMLDDLERLHRDSEEDFLASLCTHKMDGREDSEKFARNYYRANRGIEIMKEVHEIENSIDNKKPFVSLSEDEKEKITNFVKKHLGILFEGIKSVKDEVSKNSRSTQMSKLVSKYKDALDKLEKKITSSKEASALFHEPGMKKFILPESYLLGKGEMSIGDFEKDYLGKDTEIASKIVKEVINYLEKSLEDKSFNEFVKFQKQKLGINDSEDEDEVVDKIFSSGENLEKNKILENFSEIASDIEAQMNLITDLYGDEESLEDSSLVGFNDAKSYILKMLQTVGKNFKKFKDLKSLSDDSFSQLINELQSLVKRWEAITHKKMDVIRLKESTKNFIDSIR